METAYPQFAAAYAEGKTIHTQKEKLVAALKKHWNLTPEQFPFFAWAIKELNRARDATAFINRGDNTELSLGTSLLGRNMILRARYERNRPGPSGEMLGPTNSDFNLKRATSDPKNEVEIKGIDLESEEVKVLLAKHGKVFDKHGFIVSGTAPQLISNITPLDMADSNNPDASTPPSKVFRFRDLPAEMRNRVYEESLTHHRIEGCAANTALLRVCKQIHGEAKGIFKANSTFSITIMCNKPAKGNDNDDHVAESVLEVGGDISLTHSAHTELDTFYDSFPETLKKAERVTIEILGSLSLGAMSEWRKIECFIYGLVGCLQAVSVPEHRIVHVILPGLKSDADGAKYADLLEKIIVFPFVKLPSCFDITFENCTMPQEFAKLREKASDTLSYFSLEEWMRLRARLIRLVDDEPVFKSELTANIFQAVKVHAIFAKAFFTTMSFTLRNPERRLIRSLKVVSFFFKSCEKGRDLNKDMRSIARLLAEDGARGTQEDSDLTFWH